MASNDYPGAVRTGVMAAARLHRELGLRAGIERQGGNVDIFGVFQMLNIPLLIRPLDGLLGAYLRDPDHGVLITTKRPMSIQRWTASHELGHYWLKHNPSLDDDNVLRRMPMAAPAMGGDFQEDEANAFATAFLMPRWLILWHCQRHGWTTDDFRDPAVVYQLSLRLGASYEATCWTLARDNYIPVADAQELVKVQPKKLKSALLGAHQPDDYRGDVWLLTKRDAGTQINGSRNDLFVLRLEEHSGGGYLWNIDQLRDSGFAIVRNETEALDEEGVGAPVIRRVTAISQEAHRGLIVMDERRPWDPALPLSTIAVEYDFTGPEEEGLSRSERRSLLEAA
jgi:Zn-dependent peptidase ImmA (M78 family)